MFAWLRDVLLRVAGGLMAPAMSRVLQVTVTERILLIPRGTLCFAVGTVVGDCSLPIREHLFPVEKFALPCSLTGRRL